ncbi:TfoX/Sxy family protein [Actinomycetospora atypica]|uniref:TfoX/Sxy family protein n=1 Tax=Actinomycetospora atypica TaxID=1290095 RepID=A0ABV9YID7_9PSEU
MGDDTADRIRAMLPVPWREKAMFGGLSFMVDDKMLLNVRRGGDLLVRVDPERSEKLVAEHGVAVAEMGAGRSMGPSWLTVPAEQFAGDEQLRVWLDEALAFNRQAVAHPRRRR